MNYAVYARVSTDKEEQISSVGNQIDICRNWLERNGFQWNDDSVYKDEGISGTLLLDRPAMQNIIEKAKLKEIDMIIFKSLSRLTRDLKDSLELREIFQQYKVRVVSVEEGYDSFQSNKNDMNYELWSFFAAQYSRTLSVGITSALAAKVRRGEHIGKVPYGYDVIDKKLVINEEEAQVVRLMFELYTEGLGYKKITKKLNELGYLSKTKQLWQVTSVQSILQNKIYYGTFILNKHTTIKVGGRKKQVKNPEERWIVFENHHPGIITEEDWMKANSKEVTNKKKKITAWNELRGILKCSECGSNMIVMQSHRKKVNGTKTIWAYLKCSRHRRYGQAGCVSHEPITYSELRKFVIEQLIQKGKEINLKFNSDFENQMIEEKETLKKKQVQLITKNKRLLDLYLENVIDKSQFEEKKAELDKELKATEDQIIKLGTKKYKQTQITNISNAFKELERMDQDLHHIFSILIKEIVMHPDGTLDFEYAFKNSQ
ncbi:serine recombinase [Desulfuribacillus stibiiarsenatis]|uniref:Serine recombinase n=1 Tax=Desulfuribacillus stibiiarsenatis TaxID=1390249 RepID=A0A1E5L647_9FIRM|nr:recombinase family protein [Desulfuribacillus stibiiarsenatis]OEH85544.1 serine recombinase [Desulfuribacillus stibiiarsenatis]